IGATHVVSTPLATRGDRSVAARLLFIGPDGEVEVLSAFQIDDHGRFLKGVGFDPDEIAGALAQLDAWYAEELPPEHSEPWRVWTALAEKYNARDFDGIREELLAADAVIVDERMTGWGTLDRHAFVDHLRELVALAPDAFLACITV